jgi:hypothetical protein
MKYIIDRKLEFKTVPPRWEPFKIYEQEEQAHEDMFMFTEMLDGHKAPGGGVITAYRVRESG